MLIKLDKRLQAISSLLTVNYAKTRPRPRFFIGTRKRAAIQLKFANAVRMTRLIVKHAYH